MRHPKRHLVTWCRLRVVIVGVLSAVSLLPLACTTSGPTQSSAVKPPPSPVLFDTGKRLYEKHCATCHGLRGEGSGPAAYLLYPKPRDFTQNEFRLVSTNTMQATDEDLFLAMTRGMPGSAMPSWEALTPEQRWALVYYIRYLTEEPRARADGRLPKDAASQDMPWSVRESLVVERTEPDALIHVPQETPNTPEGVARGREIFAQACASCHGPMGKGDGHQTMHVDTLGYPIKPRDLTAGIFKGSSESKDLYYRIVAGLPGSPMPSYAGVYTDDQLWDLIHYVQSLVPPGVEGRVRLHPTRLHARRIRQVLATDPADPIWQREQATYIAVTPLWWRDQRIEGLDIKALHNGKELAFHLSWDDPTRDDSLVSQQAFSDGVAVQLSTEPDPPFFGMGGDHGAVAPPPAASAEGGSARSAGPFRPAAGGGVAIWHWKAAWQQDLAGWQDIETAYPDAAVDWYPGQRDYRHGDAFEVRDAKTASQEPSLMAGWGAENPLSTPTRTSAAEEVAAKGLGTLTSKPLPIQRVQATGEWREGRWRVVLRRPLAPPPRSGSGWRPERSRGVPAEKNDLVLRPGQKVSVAFAVWDGQAEDRDGQKSVSIWNQLYLE